MMQRTTSQLLSVQPRSSISNFRATLTNGLTTGFTAAALLAYSLSTFTPAARAQDTSAASAAPPAATQPVNDISLSNQKPTKVRKSKEDRVVASKDTKKVDRKLKKDNPLLGQDVKLPDKTLYDKAEDAIKHGRFDVGRLDLQTLLNTYPESQFMMRAKLAIADSWYKEGGTAALTQAEQEYKDFITFFPNAPEAAEAQMRVGDIYFREMDKPDRDYTTTTHAEQEYRLMLQQFPDSPLVPQASQRLREVQEVLASRETNIASFYATRSPANYPAAIARFQTVADTYPLYSHMDDVLIGLGDAYMAEANFTRSMKINPNASKAQQEMLESGKARLLKIYEQAAQSAYDKVVLEHAAAPHVEDAKDRLVGMGVPVPTPTPEQLAASTALENSRGQYTLSKRALTFFLHQADTVQAATAGEPPLEDPTPTNAATVVRKSISDFNSSMNPGASQAAAPAPTAAAPDTSAAAPAAAPAALSLEEVPAATAAPSTGSAITTTVPQSSPSTTSGSSMGIEIVRPDPNAAPSTTPGSTTFPGTAPAAAIIPGHEDLGVAPVGPANATPLAPVEKPAVAPDPINDAASHPQPAAQVPAANGKKKPKVACDKNDESCSTKKPKKGLSKINPF
jgi:outer membrane protein assembly factor BamD